MRLFWILVIFVSAISPARADPFSIGVSLIGAFTSLTGITTTLSATVVGQIALAAGETGRDMK